ncbi:MAG: hypothetical protein R3E88_16145 [Myxococcota bacterium]
MPHVRIPRSTSAALLGVAATLLLAATARAGDGGFARTGAYIGAGGTWVTDVFEDDVADFASGLAGTNVDVDIHDTWGATALLGYRALPFLAVEAQYEYVDDFGVDASGAGVSGRVDLRGHVLTGNLKLVLPTWRIQPYVLAGLGVVWYRASGGISGLGAAVFEDDRAFAGRVGAGVDLVLSESWLLQVGASAVLTTEELSSNATAEDLDGIHYVGAGATLQYRF